MRTRVLLAALLMAACASEEWDNRFDPESDTFRRPCAEAPENERAQCVLWEEFDAGLTRWRVGPSPSGVEAIRVDATGPEGAQTVLRMPACSAGDPGIALEVDEPVAPLGLEIIWRLEDPKAGQISLSIAGLGGETLLTTGPAAAPYEGWQVTHVSFSGGGEASFVGLDCAPSAFFVARIALRKPAP